MKKEIFKANPNLDCYFETSDGNCFYTANAAENHAKTLKDRKVKKVSNDEPSKEDSSEDETRKAKLVQLQETELVKANYNAMKALVNYFELEVDDFKAETLIEALTAYKLKLQA